MENEELPTQVNANAGLSEMMTIKMRCITITGMIDEDNSCSVIRALMGYEVEDCFAPITIFINTCGGAAYEAFAIYDLIKSIRCPIITVGFGKVMSAGTLLLSAGTKGQRYATKNTYFMTHDVQCGQGIGHFLDVDARHEHNKEIRLQYFKLMADNTKFTLSKWMKLVDAEKYFDTEKALEYGLIDHIGIKKPIGFYR
jgi:ATP-dependent Clp protease protease subunit